MPLNLIDWDNLKKKVMSLPKEEAQSLLNTWESDLTANLTAVKVLQEAVDDSELREDIKDRGWADFEKELRSVFKKEKKPEKRNCPNCIYCHILEEKDKSTYKTFCTSCGHWLDWEKRFNCKGFIPK